MTTQKILTVTLNPAVDLACTVPGFTAGGVNRVSEYRTDPGGKGVNIARLARLLGVPVMVTGFLGVGNQHIFQNMFRELGIEDEFVRVPGETRIGVKVLDPDAQSTTDINFPGLIPQEAHVTELVDTVGRMAAEAAIVVIAGSVPANLAPEIVGTLVETAKTKGAKVAVDTSGPALGQAIKCKPWLIKPNVEELSEFLGKNLAGKREIAAEAGRLVESGIDTVIVSQGAQGALIVTGEQALQARPPRVEVVSTVGAGDAMVCGMVSGMALGLTLEERIRLAMALSAATVTYPGPSLPDLSKAKSFQKTIEIDPFIFQGG